MLLLGGIGIVIGVVTYGYKVMATIGNKITQLTPTRGYAATVAASIVVVAASGIGMPVSTSHIAVGAVIGVGITRGIGALDMRVIAGIIISWSITLPIAGILAAIRAIAFTLEERGRAMRPDILGVDLRFFGGSANCAWDTEYLGVATQGRTCAG